MPAEQINFRYNLPASTGVRLLYRLKKGGYLMEGLMHFPAGCNALVQVRVMLGIGGQQIQVTPIDNQFIALDDANYRFIIDRRVSKDDIIYVEMNNYDAVNTHQISVIVTLSSERYRIY